MRERGQTLYELMISLAMIGIIAGLCASIVGFARREDRLASGYADDLRHLNSASDILTSEIRGAHSVALTPAGVQIDGVHWYVADDALHRDDAVAVRGVSRLAVTPREDDVWVVAVSPVARREGAHVPALTASVRMRVEVPR